MNLRRRLLTTNDGIQYDGPWSHWRGKNGYTGYAQIKGQLPFYEQFINTRQSKSGVINLVVLIV